MHTTRGVSSKKFIIVLVVIILIVAGLLVVMRQVHSHVAEKPSGTIFVSSTQDITHPILETYALHIDTGVVDIVGSDEASTGNLYSFSNGTPEVVFMAATMPRIKQVQDKKLTSGDLMQVYESISLNNGDVPLATQATLIAQDTSTNKTLPVVSDDGASVLYVSSLNASSTSPSVESRSIHLVSINTKTATTSADRVLFKGTQPQWYSNDAFYYVSSDGVRQYVISKKLSTLVLPLPGQLNFKLSISPDRHFLAFSNPDAHKVYIYTLSSGGLILTSAKSLDMLGFWTVFSPDSHFIAIQTADTVQIGSTAPAHPRLVIFDTTDFAQQSVMIPLDPLLNQSLFVTAWK